MLFQLHLEAEIKGNKLIIANTVKSPSPLFTALSPLIRSTLVLSSLSLSLLGLSLLSLSGCASKHYAPLTTATNVDLARYAGVWYEIFSLPNSFQANCVGTKAQYTLADDGSVKVKNSCHDKTVDGPLRTAEGTAWVVTPPDNSKLKVQFFWPFKGDYWILELDTDYRYVLLGTPSRKYFWILARTPTLEEGILQRLLKRAEQAGFDVAKGNRTVHG